MKRIIAVLALAITAAFLTGCEGASPRDTFAPPGSYCLSPSGEYIPVADDATC